MIKIVIEVEFVLSGGDIIKIVSNEQRDFPSDGEIELYKESLEEEIRSNIFICFDKGIEFNICGLLNNYRVYINNHRLNPEKCYSIRMDKVIIWDVASKTLDQ